MPTAVFLSPHLDDAAFSCAESMLALKENGWRVIVATVFTATVDAPRGFALACQRDKGLADDVDYMALRRAEDRAFAERLGVAYRHLDLPEAPHRGYEDVAALFGDLRDDDPAHTAVIDVLHALFADVPVDVCFSPIGIGGHVDHAVVVAGLAEVLAKTGGPACLHYADQPYALRYPTAAAAALDSPAGATQLRVASDARRRRVAIDAIAEYASQIPFQFGDLSSMRRTLDAAFITGTPFRHCSGSVDVLAGCSTAEPVMPPFAFPSRVGSDINR